VSAVLVVIGLAVSLLAAGVAGLVGVMLDARKGRFR